MQEMNFIQTLHTATKRDYFARMNPEKPECVRIAKQWGPAYWDGDRKFGFGGMHYDGRYAPVAKAMANHYKLKPTDKIIDIGCGKGFLLHEIKKHAGASCIGTDISEYAITHGMGSLAKMPCTQLKFPDAHFDFTYSINVFHNLSYADLKKAIQEMMRVTKPDGNSYICVESYRNDTELMNLQCWALTCLSFYSLDDWKNILSDNGYTGDVEFITFP